MKSARQAPAARDATLAKPLAPEDVRVGDYVAVLDEEHEWPACYWSLDPPLGGEPVVRARTRPSEPSPPLRVLDACLPFVFVEAIGDKARVIDLRSTRLARLDRAYAERVRARLQPKRRKRKRKK